jgi:hypothetical protein
MPRPTKPEQPGLPRRVADRRPLGLIAIVALGAVYALAEFLAGLFVGRFFAWGRAEALLFFALRPWLLLVAALLAARLALRERALLYIAGLALAGLSHSLFLLGLGAANPWAEAARGLLGGILLAALLDGAVQLGRRLIGRAGQSIAATAAVALFLIPNGLLPYERIVSGARANASAESRPDLMLLTALPLVWGELGPLGPGSKPAASYTMLEREFRIRPLDVLDEAGLRSGRLLLLAQPRALAPSELVALDTWVRQGGRVLILTDPALAWPSELPLGDSRRPPAIGLLPPLLEHWGLFLHGTGAEEAEDRRIRSGGRERRLTLLRPGRFEARSPDCAVSEEGRFARCRLGRGRALALADADLLHDALWTGPAGAARHVRLADNPLIVADLLDGLSGTSRPRVAGDVEWRDPAADRRAATLFALLPLLLAATPAAFRAMRRRR